MADKYTVMVARKDNPDLGDPHGPYDTLDEAMAFAREALPGKPWQQEDYEDGTATVRFYDSEADFASDDLTKVIAVVSTSFSTSYAE